MDPDQKKKQFQVNTSRPESGATLKDCMRCGSCCEKGGPCMHKEDQMLIEKGRIPSKNLYTLRQGEQAHDNVKGCLVAVASDIIKIKGRQGSWTCIFFDDRQKACTIYNDRPLECRKLKCWDTGELEQMYNRSRPTRKDLLATVEGLWELVEDHQQRCDYGKIEKLIKNLDGPKKDQAQKELIEIIQYDAEIRKLVVEKGGLDSAMLDFIFGRPLTRTLPGFGIKFRQEGKKTIVTPK